MRRRQLPLLLDSLLLGVVGALSTRLFDWMLKLAQFAFLTKLAGYHPPGLPDEGGVLRQVIGKSGLWLVPLATTLGGLISGVLVFAFAPEAEGHGTDTAVKAFHRDAGRIRWRVPPLKMLASAITIGSGGSAGREGPTALITAGIGSAFATLTKRTEEERRTLVLVGMAAGLSAMFRSPIGAALFSIEVLYSDMDFEAQTLLYAMFSAIVAYALNGLFVSWQPLFFMPQTIVLDNQFDYGWFVLLGLVSGVFATFIPSTFYQVRDFFLRIPIPAIFKPALGGLLLGGLAMLFPQILGGGYGWIQGAINDAFSSSLLFQLALAKLLALSLTVGSGGSGGVFAPCLYIGAMVGGLLASLLHQPAAPFVVVGMASVFGAAARVPVATLLMVAEMTGGFQLLVPAALAVLLSYVIQAALSQKLRYQSLYESQVSGRYQSPAHILEHLKVTADLIQKRKLTELSKLEPIDAEALLSRGFRVVFPDGERLGIATVAENSPWNHRALSRDLKFDNGEKMEIISVLRQKEILAPGPDVEFQASDRVLALGSEKAWNDFRDILDPKSTA